MFNTLTNLFCPKTLPVETVKFIYLENNSLTDFYEAFFYTSLGLMSLNIVNHSLRFLYKAWLNNELTYSSKNEINPLNKICVYQTDEESSGLDTDNQTDNEVEVELKN